MQLILLAFGTFISEDLACISAGVLVAQGKLHWLPATLACLIGIFIGDLLLYAAGAASSRWILKRVDSLRLTRAKAWLASHQTRAVLLSRFTPGMRLPTYVAAGILRIPFHRFTANLLVAAAVWTPVLVGATAWAGEVIVRQAVHQARGAVIAIVVLWAVLWLARNITAIRKLRWEFWPVWAAYLPLIPYLVWLAVKHRSLTLFTAANPGIPGGGFAGESKSAILEQLEGRSIASYDLISATLNGYARTLQALKFIHDRALDYPVVLKPDVGERGNGVAIIRSHEELEHYLHEASADILIQQFIPGSEFGIFYYRFPHEASGRVWSITEKQFPSIVGDGVHTVERLIRRDPRAVCMIETYLGRLKRPSDDIIASGERVPLVDVGSHCKGAVFLDGRPLLTAQLQHEVDRISRSFPGFSFGRFDVRTPSPEALKRGEFTIIELNGVTAEPTHIYDPAVSVLDAYRAMAHQWRTAFAIGEQHQRLGITPTSFSDLLRLVLTRQSSNVFLQNRARQIRSDARLLGR